jgi:hypothetical protein
VKSDQAAASVAAGISTRLLNVAACKMLQGGDTTAIFRDDTVGILTPIDMEQAEKYSKIASMLNKGPLFVGDVLVVSGPLLQKFCNSNDIDDFRLYQPCKMDDQFAVFVNKLHGGKGETPTTVVQWSKGTAHYSS